LTELQVPDTSFVVFVDDTGHEALVEGHPVYGLGGCATMASELEPVLRGPWREVRRKITGSADIPLHASSFSRTATLEQIEVVAQFFRTCPFARLGAVVTVKSQVPDELGRINLIAGALQNRIVDIARWRRFTQLDIVFESSDRANTLVSRAFGKPTLTVDGGLIPIECYFMRKAEREPALEVADFVMHAVGRQARRDMAGKNHFAPDFAAVFHDQDQRFVSYLKVDNVRRNENPGRLNC
jgi:hypothetical protein